MNRAIIQPAVLIAAVVSLALLAGVFYAGVRIHNDNQEKNAAISRGRDIASGHASVQEVAAELAHARSVASAELERLNLFITYGSSPQALAEAREDIYDSVLTKIIATADGLAIMTPLTTSAPLVKNLQQQIEDDRQKIQDLLAEWKKIVTDPVERVSPEAQQSSIIYADEIKRYIDEVNSLIDQLTPANSGLTPEQIAADKSSIEILTDQIDQIIADLGQPSVPPSVVDQQRQDVADAQQHVDDVQQILDDITSQSPGGGTTSSGGSGTTSSDPITNTDGGGTSSGDTENIPAPITPPPAIPGTRYIPPLPPIDPSKPKLIEGTNADL